MAGGLLFFWFVATVSAIALFEFYALARAKGASPQTVSGLVLGFCINAVFIFDRLKPIGPSLATISQLILIVLLTFVALVLVVELFRNKGSAFVDVGMTVLGVCYVSLFLGSLVGLRELFAPENFPVYRLFDFGGGAGETIHRWGGLTVATVFASIWICDSAAYFVGIAYGKHKLYERISPNKTWEGALAGFAAAVVTFIIARAFFLEYMSFGSALMCGCIVGVFGQIGDMVESLFKRDAGVKDSSSLIPGHGGALDRFDSLIFVSPLLFLYFAFIVF